MELLSGAPKTRPGSMSGTEPLLSLSTMGCRAWLAEAPGTFDLHSQRRVWALAARLGSDDRVETIIPGVTNLLVVLKEIPADAEQVTDWLQALWLASQAVALNGRRIEIPVTYGGEQAIDLEEVCRHTGLAAGEVVRRHYRAEYTVCAVGSAPGFGYLHGLDPALATPRKKTPSLNMLKGTVTIGGPQTGVSVLTGPNGWNAIGYACADFFDPLRDPPALIAPGDIIRFVPEKIEL